MRRDRRWNFCGPQVRIAFAQPFGLLLEVAIVRSEACSEETSVTHEPRVGGLGAGRHEPDTAAQGTPSARTQIPGPRAEPAGLMTSIVKEVDRHTCGAGGARRHDEVSPGEI